MRSKWFVLIGVSLLLYATAPVAIATHAPAAVAPVCQNVHTTDLSNWNLSETRAQGHNELVDGGLHIWTESNTSLDKAAGYYAFSAPLTSITSGSLNYSAAFGIPPGMQLVVDIDGNSAPDGILVGEAVYGANWWLTNSATPAFKAGAPHTGGGNGSNWFGTLSEWGISFPSAQVIAVGYSLGSGVHGDGIIISITFGCNVFTFGLPGSASPVAPPSAGFVCLVMVNTPISGPMYAQWLNGRSWASWDGFVVQDPDKHGGIEISLHNHDGESNAYQFYRVLGNNGGEARYFELLKGGLCTEISDPLAGG